MKKLMALVSLNAFLFSCSTVPTMQKSPARETASLADKKDIYLFPKIKAELYIYCSENKFLSASLGRIYIPIESQKRKDNTKFIFNSANTQLSGMQYDIAKESERFRVYKGSTPTEVGKLSVQLDESLFSENEKLAEYCQKKHSDWDSFYLKDIEVDFDKGIAFAVDYTDLKKYCNQETVDTSITYRSAVGRAGIVDIDAEKTISDTGSYSSKVKESCWYFPNAVAGAIIYPIWWIFEGEHSIDPK